MQYRLKITGVDYSDMVLINSVSINYGRTDIASQPSPGTFNASITVLPGETLVPISLDALVEFEAIDQVAMTWEHLFTGYVSDVNVNISTWSNGTGIQEYQITALGHLSRFNRCNVGTAGFTKKYDCDRIDDIVTDSGAGMPVTVSRATGIYEIAAVSNGNYDALQLMQDTANSAMGVLCDTPDPDDIGYTPCTYTTYLDRAFLPTVIFTTDDVIASGLTASKSMTRLVNKAWVTYGASSASTSTIYVDTTSGFSEIAANRATYLHNLSDANSIAQILLAGRKQELYELTTLTFNTSALTDSVIQGLFSIRNGHRLQISGLPFDEVTSFDGYIEGWSWQINKDGSTMTLNVSNYGQTYPYTLWNDVNVTDTWNTIYTATTTWEDIV